MKDTTAAFWLSKQQEHAWSMLQLHPWQNAVAIVLIEGPLHTERLRQGLRELAARHEILRTVFRRPAGMKIPFQIVSETCDPAWETMELTSNNGKTEHGNIPTSVLDKFENERTRLFPLEDQPCFRACLCRFGAERFALNLALPLLIADLYTLQRIAQELGAIYSGPSSEISGERLRYVQFAQWQNELLESDEPQAREGKQHWEAVGANDALSLT